MSAGESKSVDCKILRGHTDDVNSVSFSGDGSRIVSGSFDRTIRVWDVSVMNEWDGLVDDVKSWKQAWNRARMPVPLLLQKAVWYAESLKTVKAKASKVGFKIDNKLYELLLTWCNEFITQMKSIYNSAAKKQKRLRLRF